MTLTVTDEAGCSTGQTFTGQTVSCDGSSAAQVSHQLTVPGGPPPPLSPTPAPPSSAVVLRGLKVSPASFSSAGRRVGGRCVKPDKDNKHRPPCTRKAKLTISYTLSAAAAVTFETTGRLSGREVGGRCVAPTPGNRHKGTCRRPMTSDGSIVRHDQAGADRFVLERKLAPGTYTTTATPTGGAGEHVTYRIVG